MMVDKRLCHFLRSLQLIKDVKPLKKENIAYNILEQQALYPTEDGVQKTANYSWLAQSNRNFGKDMATV